MTKTLRELHEAATPGRWEDHHPPGAAWIGSPFDGPISAYRHTGSLGGVAVIARDLDDEDAALIAAMRNALPLLLDIVDAARAVAHAEHDREWEVAHKRLHKALAALDGAA